MLASAVENTNLHKALLGIVVVREILPGGHIVRDCTDVFRAENAGRPWRTIDGMPKDELLEPVERCLQRRS